MVQYAFATSLIFTLALAFTGPRRLSVEQSETDKSMSDKITIRIGDRTFGATLSHHATAAAFKKLLPLSITLKELNGNEKFAELPLSLPTEASTPRAVRTGDLMLYGSSTLVLFYKSFTTTYRYTNIGRPTTPRAWNRHLVPATLTSRSTRRTTGSSR